MAILRWRDPFENKAFRELNRLQEEMNSLFDRVFGRRSISSGPGVFPAVNVAQDEEVIFITAELPGIDAKDLDIVVEDDAIIIKGERKIESEGENVSYHRRERDQGAFSRTIPLPTRVNAGRASADVKNGVLTLNLQKAEEVKPKKIDIKVQ